MTLKIAVLPGDGVGPEVTAVAIKVLRAACTSHELHFTEGLIGGAAIHATGQALPDVTRQLALESNAVLFGAVGLPEFDAQPPARRPEAGLLGLRKALGLWANLRPA